MVLLKTDDDLSLTDWPTLLVHCLQHYLEPFFSSSLAKTRRNKDTNTQRHKDTKTQRHKDTKTQKHKDTKTQIHHKTTASPPSQVAPQMVIVRIKIRPRRRKRLVLLVENGGPIFGRLRIKMNFKCPRRNFLGG